MKKLVAYVISVIFLFTILFTGCGSSGSSTSSKNSDQQSDTATSSTKKITVWAWDPNFNIAIMNDAKAIYTKEHPDVQIDVVEMARDEVEQKLNTILASGVKEGLPDIVLIEDYSAQKYLQAYPGAFADLTDKIDYSKFAKYKVELMTLNGRTYGIPFDSGVTGLFYRRDILEQAGFKPEDLNNITWDRFIEIGKKVKEKTGKDLIGFDPADGTLMRAMVQSAGKWFFDKNGEPNLVNNPAVKEAVTTYNKIFHSGVAKKVNGWNDWVATFTKGDVAAVVTGAWIIGSIKSASDQSGKWALAPTPRLNLSTSINASNTGGSSWYVLNYSKNKDVAIDFLKEIFAGNIGFYQKILVERGAIATYLPAQSGSAYSAPDPFFGGQKIYVDLSEYMKKVPPVNYGVYTYETINAIMNVIPDVYSGKISVDAALKEAEEQAKSEINR
ncbi:extracellular solute-binding protein family 1 [Thermoanaerobacter italicus Ab9]|uniref:Extracellular solute-binding protein family 1 n=1 Tax=Thermoanaerobacter italicus (strain DSM 9252 / Ab9) TaxID=580331 RepID=D3T413_THEIA|nr:sugar ABC transporter substrate-binding protein [Thermoanaerobacter italicus]ADD02965.1 extracellular solute-binding protein family 1 [Thermoanaerobacter italicus Ab9]